jgi:lipoprotein-anchoring transpeptidase ErfK/SrfK
VITVDRPAFKLRFFKRLRLAKTFKIAVGQVGLETPAGLYHVQNKAIDPAWHVPNSAWAGKLAGKVIPGGVPENPLKARWLGIYNGAGIHGTADVGSLGSAASHGCIRMAIPDVEELYDQTPLQTPVFIQ